MVLRVALCAAHGATHEAGRAWLDGRRTTKCSPELTAMGECYICAKPLGATYYQLAAANRAITFERTGRSTLIKLTAALGETNPNPA